VAKAVAAAAVVAVARVQRSIHLGRDLGPVALEAVAIRLRGTLSAAMAAEVEPVVPVELAVLVATVVQAAVRSRS
jgi:hypothetical protein